MLKIAILGSGLSGLSLAHLLKEVAEVSVFEKARGVGGRMSTRRIEPWIFDHGAQFFTARTAPFQRFISPYIQQGVIERWNARYVLFDGNQIVERKHWRDDEPRYVALPAMNSLCKHLAKDMTLHLNCRIVSLKKDSRWQLIDEHNRAYGDFDWVISTAPPAQTAALFPESFPYWSDLNTIEMHACFALMLGYSSTIHLDFDAARVNQSDISWIAVNSTKPGREAPTSLVVHSSAQYADAHIDDNHERVMQNLCDETSRITGLDVLKADYKAIHGWRYANNVSREQQPVYLDTSLGLAACGDWSLGGRVEGAFTSAYQLVNAFKASVL